jgi:hypothetical protein
MIQNPNDMSIDNQDLPLPTFGGMQTETKPKMEEVEQAKKIVDTLFIEEINNMIRMNCQEQELVRFIQQYQVEKAKLINKQ